MADETIRILLRLQTVGDSLAGDAERHDGETREFTGWLGLLGALQVLLADTDLGRTADGEPVREPEPCPELPSQTKGPT